MVIPAIRFGLPIFVKPLKEETRGEITSMSMSGGVVTAAMKNSGNVHLLVRTVLVQGKDGAGKPVFTKELSGWYLLAGAQRVHTAEVPADVAPGFDVVVPRWQGKLEVPTSSRYTIRLGNTGTARLFLDGKEMIQSAGDALDFLLVGAAAVQVGTANFRNPNACVEIVDGIRDFLVREKIFRLDDYRGTLRLQE